MAALPQLLREVPSGAGAVSVGVRSAARSSSSRSVCLVGPRWPHRAGSHLSRRALGRPLSFSPFLWLVSNDAESFSLRARHSLVIKNVSVANTKTLLPLVRSEVDHCLFPSPPTGQGLQTLERRPPLPCYQSPLCPGLFGPAGHRSCGSGGSCV